ncbi:iron chelate uptake ABC transporter family permease subunit [Corynebacterium striatum]|uniref:iron chelate uptake ABC transporter family permease subunit n=1 Tax=Corynebacterium striatum TaxID=43770 RepID=UPI003F7E5C3C
MTNSAQAAFFAGVQEDFFRFGDDVAASLCINVAVARSSLLTLTALVTAALVSIVGAVGFVGLFPPPDAYSWDLPTRASSPSP